MGPGVPCQPWPSRFCGWPSRDGVKLGLGARWVGMVFGRLVWSFGVMAVVVGIGVSGVRGGTAMK